MSKTPFRGWTIHHHSDQTPPYTAVEWEARHGDVKPTGSKIQSESLETVREILQVQMGKVLFPRDANDAPGIIESWI